MKWYGKIFQYAINFSVEFHGQIEPRSELSSGMKDQESLISGIAYFTRLAAIGDISGLKSCHITSCRRKISFSAFKYMPPC